LHIVVLTHSVPDTAAEPRIEGGAVVWSITEPAPNPWDEYAVEEALRLHEAHGGTVTALAAGPPADEVALREALAMGCDDALRIWSDALAAAGPFGLARAAAAAVRAMGDVALVIAGKEMIDGNADLIHLGMARALGWPALTHIAKIIDITPAAAIKVERHLDAGREVVSARLPAVLSVVKAINEPRYPTFVGRREAREASIAVRPPRIKAGPSKVEQVALYAPLAHTGEVELIDAETPEAAAWLLAQKLIEDGLV
jgi:electron transfer flavoprotein beta subunit